MIFDEDFQKLVGSLNLLLKEQADFYLKMATRDWMFSDAIILSGEYAGRTGKISSIIYDGNQLLFQCRPYKLDRKGGRVEPEELLWDRADARSYWPVKRLRLLAK